jgi:hypothetical protein
MLGRSDRAFALASLIAVAGLIVSNCVLLLLDETGGEPVKA